ncbi:putative bifunctional diguanylate cyclase/phosphodiesterase [Endothiovibrio diazotrophicus]
MDGALAPTAFVLKPQPQPTMSPSPPPRTDRPTPPRSAQSLRQRFLFLALLVWLLLLPASLYTQDLVDQTARRGTGLIREQGELSDGLKRLKNAVQGTEAGIYQYAFLLEETVRQRVEAQLIEAHRQIDRLERSRAAGHMEGLREHIGELRGLLARLSAETEGFFQLLSRIESRYPAVPTQVNVMDPADHEFIGAINLVLDTTPERDIDETYHYFIDLRYNWIQMVNAGRVAMMSRAGVFGIPAGGMEQFRNNRQLYADTVNQLLDELQRLDGQGRLNFEQSAALPRLEQFNQRYEAGYRRAMAIYRSENWRTDLPYLRDRLRPLFAELWSTLYRLEEHLGTLTTRDLSASLNTAGTLSNLIWLLFGVTTFVILLAFWLFEYAIRRPIAQVAAALEAEGHGGASHVPEIRVRTRETDALLEAFSGMREQVRSRQLRMQAILDNAAEGIITIDEHGTIEIFNNAAQQLFGYRAEEAIGRNVRLIVPPPHQGHHDQYLKRYLENGEARIIGSAREVEGRHKDGSLIPISLKISEIKLPGGRLFTALVEDTGERRAMMDYLRHLAEHDTLTGLHNRQYFLAELERAVARTRRNPHDCCSLLYIDLDNFKYVNDTLGHQAGDKVLMEVSGLLERRARKADLLARLGGDEFAVILYNLDLAGAQTAADGFRKLLADYAFKYEGKVVDVGCSIGVAQLTDEVRDKEELMAQADLACHIAKRGGRNRVHVYQRRDRERVANMETDMGWSLRIKAAIEQDHFRFARQPIADAASGEIRAYEILLRMEDAAGELIMPAGFLPAAERFGLLTAIDRWVVEHAIEQLARQRIDEPGLHYAINLSAEAIDHGAIFTTITDALERFAVPADALTFEVTETQAIANLGHAVDFLQKLRALGCKTALDDFGAGYCSFAYLKEMPVDHIKIDGSFVRDVCHSDLQRAMVKAMVDIAGAIGIHTVAEFVEDAACLDLLRNLGVDAVQGYHIGRPELI